MTHRHASTESSNLPPRDWIAHWLERMSRWSLAALLITLPFWRHRVLLHRPLDPVFFEFHDVTLYTNDLFWWGALGAWLLSRLVRRPPAMRTGPWFLFWPLIGLLSLALLGIPFAVDPLTAAYQASRLVLLLALYLLLLNLPLGPGAIAWPLAAGMVVQAVVAVPQFVLGRTLGLQRLGEVSANADWSGSSIVQVGPEHWLRAYGLAQHPNLLAGCLMAMLLIVAGYYLSQRGWKALVALAALGAGSVALLLTFSRAAWLGTLLGGLFALGLVWRARHVRTWAISRSTVTLLGLVLVAVGVAFVATNGPLLQSRFWLTTQPTEVESVVARRMQIPASLTLIGLRPLLGTGLGNYATALYTLAPHMVGPDRVYQPVFAVPLLVAAELGIPGGLLWLFLIASPWPAFWRHARARPVSHWWAGLTAALLGLSVASFFDFYVWTSHQGPLALWLVLGLWAREWESATDD